MPSLTLKQLAAAYAEGRRDFRGLTIVPSDDWIPTQHTSLEGLQLQGAMAVGVNFGSAFLVGSDLTGATLSRTRLVNAVLIKVTLADCDLTEADLTDASFGEANLERARLDRSILKGASFARAKLSRASLREVYAPSALFYDADLREASLLGADLSEANLDNADLSDTDLRGADLLRARLRHANLSGADAAHANFYKAVLVGADVEGLCLVGADLRHALLSGLNWINSDFTGADLTDVTFTDASIRGCTMPGAVAQRAVLDRSFIIDSDLSGIDLTFASLNRAHVQNVKLAGATMSKAELNGAVFLQAELTDVSVGVTQRRVASMDEATRASLPPAEPESDEERGARIAAERSAENRPEVVMYSVAERVDVSVVRVFFATDRAQSPEGFGSERAEKLTYGVAEVSLPRDHRMGELEGPSMWRAQIRWERGKHVMVDRCNTRDPGRFFRQLQNRTMASAAKEAFVFVHGYNVSFDDALRRTGQMAYDLAFDGAPILYSWPSRADTALYLNDEATVETTITRLKGFIRDVLKRAQVERLHLIAHSMGSRSLVRALADLMVELAPEGPLLNHVILSAPDIDADVFKDIAKRITTSARQFTLYASSNDVALGLSRRFHGYRRAGEGGRHLTIVDGICTIDASELETDLLGHSYFAEHRSVVSDIFYVLRDQPPHARFGLRRMVRGRKEYWYFPAEGSRSWLAWIRRTWKSSFLASSDPNGV